MKKEDPSATPPLPEPDALTRSFWEACGEDRLEVCFCGDCGHRFLPPGPRCPKCWSADPAPREVSGRGHVWSFVIYRRTYQPGMPAPYVVALVELEEGPRMISNIVGCAPEEVEIGMPIELHLETAGQYRLPRFTPRNRQSGDAGAME